MLKRTAKGTPYLTEPEVCIVAATAWQHEEERLSEFLEPLFPDNDYFDDRPLDDGAKLIKFAGQLCYLSFGQQRSRNAQAAEYLRHVKEQAHGSLFQHVSYSLLFWGVSRAFTHELVRHGTGTGFSQVSQRYVAGKHLRFVESLATQFDETSRNTFGASVEEYMLAEQRITQGQLHQHFERWIDASKKEYERREQLLLRRSGIDYKTATTDQRKAVRQEARRCLPNEAEAPILVTGNLRAWRHIVEQRDSVPADTEICRAIGAAFKALNEHEPLLWEDYTTEQKRADGLPTVSTPFRKV